ncbi:helix-turn-helix transcriptional regulator [Paenibacillus kandeliae]|uniref:helix-turn-helix transcriptional regulator n=1 Tax=Paenibacillus kandeliae TaxID=3231269 RepID=UPI0034595DB7
MKLERLISIIYKLLNHEVVSATVLAEEYGVSPRTIYRDMDVIGAAGFPVISHQGSQGGYGMIDGYKLDKSLLGSHDVASLVTVLHSLSTMFEDTQVQSTIDRLQSIEPVQQMPRLDINFQSYHTNTLLLQLLRQAIAEQQVVQFDYINANNERTTRELEPNQIYFKYGAWYVAGYCRSRQSVREFRLSRMLDTVLRKEHFTIRQHEAVAYTAPNTERQSTSLQPEQSLPHTNIEVVIRINQEALAYALDHFQHAERQFHSDGSMTIRIHIQQSKQTKWLYGILLSLGENAEVLYPPEIRATMKQKLYQMLERYEQDELNLL